MSAPDGSGRIVTVLVVDDDLSVAALHHQLVDAQPGFWVVAEAHTGAEAEAAVRAHRPDLVLLDFSLPDFDGREVLRRIRSSPLSGVEVIAVTAARDLESVRFARLNGVRHYLVKPFSVSVLRERLEEVRGHLTSESGAPDNGVLQQAEVDRILTGSLTTVQRGTATPSLPKGLSAPSLELVSLALRGGTPDCSASEIADAVGMSRVSARRYLEYLVFLGRAEVAPRYGTAGRPENRYRAKTVSASMRTAASTT